MGYKPLIIVDGLDLVQYLVQVVLDNMQSDLIDETHLEATAGVHVVHLGPTRDPQVGERAQFKVFARGLGVEEESRKELVPTF